MRAPYDVAMINTASSPRQHVYLSAEKIQSGRVTPQERQALDRGMQLKGAVDMLVHQPEQFENVAYTRWNSGIKMETHNTGGQRVEFAYGTQPARSRGFQRLVSKAAQHAAEATMALGGGLARLVPTDSGKMLTGLALAFPTSFLDESGKRLAHDPEQHDQVYQRQVQEDGSGRILVSETVLLHPDGSYEYIAR
ncbi:MAG: hypothetical protein U0931_29275 [Vulcanimicrobiota bacterium]